jgi:hypothetical protein
MFPGTVRYALDQAGRTSTPTAKAIARNGLIGTIHNLVARQVTLLGMALFWGGILAEKLPRRHPARRIDGTPDKASPSIIGP